MVKKWRSVSDFLQFFEKMKKLKQNFEFQTLNTPPKKQRLQNFENDLYEMIRKKEFQPIRTEFQRKLSEDLQSIKHSNKNFVSADKT